RAPRVPKRASPVRRTPPRPSASSSLYSSLLLLSRGQKDDRKTARRWRVRNFCLTGGCLGLKPHAPSRELSRCERERGPSHSGASSGPPVPAAKNVHSFPQGRGRQGSRPTRQPPPKKSTNRRDGPHATSCHL